jgi:hypothetical protein
MSNYQYTPGLRMGCRNSPTMTNSFPLVSHSKVKAPAGVGTKSLNHDMRDQDWPVLWLIPNFIPGKNVMGTPYLYPTFLNVKGLLMINENLQILYISNPLSSLFLLSLLSFFSKRFFLFPVLILLFIIPHQNVSVGKSKLCHKTCWLPEFSSMRTKLPESSKIAVILVVEH